MSRCQALRRTFVALAPIATVIAALAAPSPAAAGTTCQATWRGIGPTGLRANPYVFDVYAVSRTNAWAVGTYENSTESAFATHWNGTSWTASSLPLPANVSDTGLEAVSGSSASDVWAAGFSD